MENADLKTCREDRGLSLDDVFRQTRISVKFLAAIEQADYTSLPPAVYTRKFIRDYTELLGCDSNAILTDYDKYLSSISKPVIIQGGENHKNQPGTNFFENVRARRWIYAAILAGLLAILAGFFIFSNYGFNLFRNAGKSVAHPSLATVNEPARADQTVKKETALATTGKNMVSGETLSTGKYHLVIEAREVTWLRIRADRNPPYQLLMNPGERIERYADQHFLIDIGNAGGLVLLFQGKDIGVIGKSGEVVHIRLP